MLLLAAISEGLPSADHEARSRSGLQAGTVAVSSRVSVVRSPWCPWCRGVSFCGGHDLPLSVVAGQRADIRDFPEGAAPVADF